MRSHGRRRGNLFLTCFCLSTLILCFSSLVLNHLQIDARSRKLSTVESILRKNFAPVVTQAKKDKDHRNRNVMSTKSTTSANDAKVGQPHPNLGQAESTLTGLHCNTVGGPTSEEITKEMVYWKDIPSDNRYVSPFKKEGITKYITFEPDTAGWNNKRMAMETVVALAIAMGRTLVLPPEQDFYMLSDLVGRDGKSQRHQFSFRDFFPLDKIAMEHAGLEIITTQEFLEREALNGNIRKKDGEPSFPPGNRTNWDGANDIQFLNQWLRETMYATSWDPNNCMAAFPASTDPEDVEALKRMKSSVDQAGGFPSYTSFIDKHVPVNAPPMERMKENWAGRKDLCIYDEEMQNARVIHFPHDKQSRILVQFYSFLFFQDWKQDLWMKRFFRDHMRYVDQIQCAAARVLDAIRSRARARGDPNGDFDSFHIRRGDFAYFYNSTLYGADRIYEISKSELREHATVYIATSVRDRSFFNPLKKHYDVVFLDDFLPLLEGVNTNYYGMIDQLVASRSRTFFGCWLSSFTGYINRLRGYHANRAKSPGYEDGIIPSWYYATEEHRNDMRTYYPIHQAFFKREFPTSWRLIDTGVDDRNDLQSKG